MAAGLPSRAIIAIMDDELYTILTRLIALSPEGDLYASVFLPSLLLGTVGGGSGQGTAAECLDLLGCRGRGGANLLAEILAATVLAGDLSLMAAFCSHEFVAAHELLGRNRPPDVRATDIRPVVTRSSPRPRQASRANDARKREPYVLNFH